MACQGPRRQHPPHQSPCCSRAPRRPRHWARHLLLAASVAVRSSAKQSTHPDPVGYFSDPPVVEPGQQNLYGWAQSFKAGTKGLNGTEIVHLTPHAGKLFGGTGFWMSAVFMPSTVVRLDSPDGDWVVEAVVFQYAGRTEILKTATFTTDKNGAALSSPVELLIAGFYVDYQGEGRCGMTVRNDATQQWALKWYYRESPFRSNYFSARALESYKDGVTGVHHLFMVTGMPGIIKGSYDPSQNAQVVFDSATESGAFPTRPLGLATMGGRLYTSGGSFIRRRNDGPNPTWSVVFDMADHWTGTVDEAVGGLRGITAIPNPSGVGESLLFAWCPNGSSRSCMTRLDPEGSGFKVTEEGCVKDLLAQVLGSEYKNPYSLANYNFALPVQTPQGLVHIVGFQALLFSWAVDDFPTDPRQEDIAASGKKLAYYAGAGYLIRRSPTQYEVRVPGGPRPKATQINPPLVSVRCHANSPWDDSIYLGGYDANFFEVANTAWVLRGTADAVHLAPVQAGTFTTTTKTTTTTSRCQLCGLLSRRESWFDLSHVDTSRSETPTSRNKPLDGLTSTWGGALTYVMDLQFPYSVSKLRVNWRSCRCSAAGSVLIRSSMDGEAWELQHQPTVNIWGEKLTQTYEVDFHGRFVAIHITDKALESQYATYWEIEMYGHPDLSEEHHELVPEAIVPTASGDAACQAIQDFANSDQYTGTCVDLQQRQGEACCRAVPDEATTTTAAPQTTTTSLATVDFIMKISASDPEEFAASAEVKKALQQSIAQAANIDEEQVSIKSLVASGDGTVRSEFTIVADGVDALKAHYMPTLSALLSTALDEEVGNDVFTASVLSVEVQKPAPPGGDGEEPGGSGGVIAAVLVTLAVVGIAAAAGWWWWKKKKHSRPGRVLPTAVTSVLPTPPSAPKFLDTE